jgi:hypothetical protein
VKPGNSLKGKRRWIPALLINNISAVLRKAAGQQTANPLSRSGDQGRFSEKSNKFRINPLFNSLLRLTIKKEEER